MHIGGMAKLGDEAGSFSSLESSGMAVFHHAEAFPDKQSLELDKMVPPKSAAAKPRTTPGEEPAAEAETWIASMRLPRFQKVRRCGRAFRDKG